MNTELIHIKLNDEVGCLVEVEASDFRQDVTAKSQTFDFAIVKKQIEGISSELMTLLKNIGPSKINLEFGIELSVESGQLTSVIVKGSAKSNIKISLEWINGHNNS